MNNENTIEDQSIFISIDDPHLKWPPYTLAMLRIGRILTAKQDVRREIRAEYISKLMHKHRNQMPQLYTGLEIREQIRYLGYLSGGGITVQVYELPYKYRSAPHYHFTFTKVYPEPAQIQNQESISTQDNQSHESTNTNN